MAELRDYLSLDYWRENLLKAAYVAWGVTLFLAFMISGFPYQDAFSAMLTPLGLKLSYQEQALGFPVGADLKNVRMSSLTEGSPAPLFQSERLALRPSLGILAGRPSIRLRAAAYDGQIAATVHRSGETIQIDFEVSDLDLDRYRALAQYGTNIGGRLSGHGSLSFNAQNLIAGAGRVELNAKGLRVRPATGFPQLTFSSFKSTLKLNNGLLQIDELAGTGPDLTLSLRGAIRLVPVLASSTMQVTMRLDPTPMGRTHLGFLFGMLPHPPNALPYQLNGSLLAPSIN